ncbi:MAG: hypothetical protein ABR583_09285 [Gaiellaceae bacterium]
MRARLVLLAALAVLGVAACGGSDDDGPSAEPTATTTTTATTNGIDTLAGAATTPQTGEPGGEGTALLERVSIGRHEGFDRVVFRFRDHVPGYRVQYVEPPLKEDGSGAPVEIEGGSPLLVRLEPASGFDLETGEGELVYDGPRRIDGADAGASVVREVVRTGDFEAVLSWAVGLDQPVDFRVLTTLDDPPRLVVDLRNH